MPDTVVSTFSQSHSSKLMGNFVNFVRWIVNGILRVILPFVYHIDCMIVRLIKLKLNTGLEVELCL